MMYLVAYSAEPNKGGEHEVGWKSFIELSKLRNDIVLVTRTANKKEILNNGSEYLSRILFIENELFIKYKPKSKFSYLYYVVWQWSVYLKLKKVVLSTDIIHLITFGNILLPSFLFLLKSKLILGPMGGGSLIDGKMLNSNPLGFKTLLLIKRILVRLNTFNLLVRENARRADVIILRTKETESLVPKWYRHKIRVMLETGLDCVPDLDEFSYDKPFIRFLFVGRLVRSKNVELLIDYMNYHAQDNETLFVVGTGPEEDRLKKRSFKANVKFVGGVHHNKVLEYMKESDVFVFPSVKEGGSHALFEAFSNNLPIVCLDISGMKVFPSNRFCISLKSKDYNSLLVELVTVMRSLRERVKELPRVEDRKQFLKNFLWSEKALNYNEFYNG